MTVNKSARVRIAFLGDVHIGSQPASPSTELRATLRNCDHVLVNLESPICDPSPICSSKVLLRTEPGLEEVLSDWHVTAATLANNHMFDHGEEGFRSTCRALASREILFAGAGATADEASRPLVLDCDGVRVGVIACAEATTQAQMATSESSGCNPLRFPHMAEQVSSVRAQADVVVVAPHWGMCDYAYPPVDVVFHGERLLDAGADIVIGHHSHIPQGMRRRKDGKTIVYSLGDLFFDTYQAGNHKIAPTEENRKGLFLILELVEGKIASVLPVFTRHCGTVVHEDTRAEREHELADRSGPLKWVECYPAHWRAVVRERLIRRVGFWANPAHWRYIRLATMQAALIMGRESILRRFHRTERAGRYG